MKKIEKNLQNLLLAAIAAGCLASNGCSDKKYPNKSEDLEQKVEYSSSKEENVILFPFKRDGKYGFTNNSGKEVIIPQFDEAGSFSEGLALVVIGKSKKGYIDKKGAFVINPQFSYARNFSEGLAGAYDDIRKSCGYIDKNGDFVIQPQFEKVKDFSSGMAAVMIGKKWGYINNKGDYVINPQFDEVGHFSEGLIAVSIGEKWGYIKSNGEFAINPQFSSASSFSEGLAAVYQNRVGAFYIGKDGKNVFNKVYEDAKQFSEGLGAVKINKMYGYINIKGEIVINPQFGNALEFHDGKAEVVNYDNGYPSVGVINKAGNIIVPFERYYRR